MLVFQTACFDVYRGGITKYVGVQKHYPSEKKSNLVTPELDFEVSLRVMSHVQMSQKILKN